MVSQKNGIHVFCGAFRTHWKIDNKMQGHRRGECMNTTAILRKWGWLLNCSYPFGPRLEVARRHCGGLGA